MPELPEVETIRRDLDRHFSGRRISGVEMLWTGVVDRPSLQEFERHIVGRRIVRVERRGKYLLLRLDGDYTLVVHLRMTGRLHPRPPDAPRDRHLRAVFTLDDGAELHFEDQRKFGRLYLVRGEEALAGVLAKVGPEPLEGFTPQDLRALLRGRRALLKPLLMDQRFLAGLGNIYVDEALFRARLHPLRRSDSLTRAELNALHEGIVDALTQGIENRGTTLSTYRDAWGAEGLNRERLLVFRREGKPCPRCGTSIEKIRVGGRGTHYCPNCQPAKGNAKSAKGKSEGAGTLLER